MNFNDELNLRTKEAETIISGYLPEADGFCRTLPEAMTYALLAGGKRLRPVLMKAVFDMLGGEGREVEPFMAGIEMIHTHSLIHDDLPAIDNDDYRRGRLTTHKVYGEAMGVLSGDALLNYAYETMLKAFDLTGSSTQVIKALRLMSEKTGIKGMLGGQSVDVQNNGIAQDEQMLEYIYRKKTSALIEASMGTGAVLAGADDETVRLVEKAASLIGMAFQIRDDILDVEGDEKTLGKPVHSDDKNHKITYVTLYGLEGAGSEVRRFSDEACGIIRTLAKDSSDEKRVRGCSFLLSLTEYLTTRDR
ncbi:MAG: polyprenyl synthetase family protein [Blautia sp.]|nr:polyprenyl synthetase family protein [Blautia sp.]